MFTLKLEEITREGLNVEWVEERESLLAYMEEFADIDFDFEAPLQAGVRIWSTGKSIMIKGMVRTILRLQCARCLNSFSYPIDSAIDLTLFPLKEASFSEEVELEKEDMELNFFEGDKINLSEIACEEVLLGIPYQPLCREECKGLCPVCGTDRNLSSCECAKQNLGSGFSALGKLKLP